MSRLTDDLMNSAPWASTEERAEWWRNKCYEVFEELEHYRCLEEQGRLIEQKHGYWTGPDDYNCSVCGENYMEIADADAYASGWKPNYCPNCGAKMDEVEK